MRDKITSAFQNSISHQLARVFRQHSRAYGRAFTELELTATHAHILIRLWMEGPSRIGALQRELALSSATFTGALNRMEKLGLLTRTKDPEDRRASIVSGVEWPEAKKRSVMETTLATERSCFAALTAAERKELARLLRKLSTAMEQDDRL